MTIRFPKIIGLFYILVAIVLLSSCGARKERSLFNAPSDIVTDTIKQVYVVNDKGLSNTQYTIKVDDMIAIRNLQDFDFNGKSSVNDVSTATSTTAYQVDKDGYVVLPAISGKVKLAGLTRKEARAVIQKLYEEKQLKDPIMDVSIVNVKVTLLGEFSKQGNFLLEKDNITLMDILGEAGGITKLADPKTLKIFRGDKANPEIIYVNLNDYRSLGSKKLVLQNNDIIVIQPTKSSALSEKLQGYNNIVQPLLVVINLAVLVFTFTR
jgi:polysaccharide export outer membrane protein